MLRKTRSLKVIDILRSVSVFDLVLILLVMLIPAAIIAKGKPSGKDTGGGSSVKITSISPDQGPIGIQVTVYGEGFTDNNSIKIKGKILLRGLVSNDGTTLTFKLPPETPCSPPSACPVKVVVENQKGESNAYPFKVTHDPLPTEPPTIPDLTIITESLPEGSVKSFYTALVEAEGGVLPYTWTISQGLLPSGLSLNTDSGLISGIPITSGVSSITVQVVDDSGNLASKDFQLTIKAAPVLNFDPVTIIGRLVDYFSGEPIADAAFFNFNAPDAIIQNSSDGRFLVTISTSDIPAMPGGAFGKSVGYRSICHVIQSIGVWRNEDSSLRVESDIFDLQNNPITFPVTSEVVDVGDVTVWPATKIVMYFDREMQPLIYYPEEKYGHGHIDYMMDTLNKALGGYVVPFNYPMTVELKEQNGTVYKDYGYTHPLEDGCSSTAVLRFSSGNFNWTSE